MEKGSFSVNVPGYYPDNCGRAEIDTLFTLDFTRLFQLRYEHAELEQTLEKTKKSGQKMVRRDFLLLESHSYRRCTLCVHRVRNVNR